MPREEFRSSTVREEAHGEAGNPKAFRGRPAGTSGCSVGKRDAASGIALGARKVQREGIWLRNWNARRRRSIAIWPCWRLRVFPGITIGTRSAIASGRGSNSRSATSAR